MTLAWWGVVLCVLFTGTEQVDRYAGIAGVGIYLIAGVATLAAGRAYLVPAFMRRVTEQGAWLLAFATLASLVVFFVWVYPFANSGAVGGGSDSDDALNLAVRALLSGQDPYRIHTPLGNPATYLPGSLLLALPFVMFGNAAYQNLFWLAVFLLAMRFYLNDARETLLLFWVTLLCPRVWQSLATGGELLASGVYMALFALFAIRTFSAEPRGYRGWTAAALLGVGLSSRMNYVLLAPVIFSATLQRTGWKQAARYAAATLAAALAVTLPFWLRDPQTFQVATFAEQNFAAIGINSMLPHADVGLPAASALFSMGIACYPRWKQDSGVLAGCALVQAFPVVALVLLSSIDARAFASFHAGYGLHYLFFGVMAGWRGFRGSVRPEPDTIRACA